MKPFIHFQAEINDNTVGQLITHLRSWNSPDTVVIDSPGGTFDFFSVRAPAIKRLGVTTVANRVYSAASVLFVLGAERVVHKDSEILFHEVRVVSTDGQHITVSDVDEYEAILHYMHKTQPPEMFSEWRRQMHNAQNWFTQFIADHTHCPVNIVRNLISEDAIISGKEAYRYGLATKFGELRIFN